jgi:hypothetical protein
VNSERSAAVRAGGSPADADVLTVAERSEDLKLEIGTRLLERAVHLAEELLRVLDLAAFHEPAGVEVDDLVHRRHVATIPAFFEPASRRLDRVQGKHHHGPESVAPGMVGFDSRGVTLMPDHSEVS